MANQHLIQFHFLHNRSEDKFQSLSVGYRDTAGTVLSNYMQVVTESTQLSGGFMERIF